MRILIIWLVLMLTAPSYALAFKIKSVDIDPDHPKAGDTVHFTAKTDDKAQKVEINFPAVPGPPVQMQGDKDGKKWQIKFKMSTAGKKDFTVTAYDKKGKKDKEDKSFTVGGGEVSKANPPTPPTPNPPVTTPLDPLRQQYGSVTGKVHKNSASGAALSGVLVNCGGKNDTTDGNGNYKVDGITAGNHEISFSKSGYEGFKKPVTVKAGQNVPVDARWLVENKSVPVPPPVPPGGTGGFTPNIKLPAYSSENPFGTRYGGQCTTFAWGRALEVTGQKLDTTKNGKYWYDMTKFPKGQSAKPKSIAVWGGDSKNQYGHVAFVEDIDRSGNVTLNEANFKKYKPIDFGGGYDGSPIKLSKQQMASRSGAGKLLGYIYLNNGVAPQDNEKPKIHSFGPNKSTIKVGETVEISYTVSDSGGSGLRQVELWKSQDKGKLDHYKTESLKGKNGQVSGKFTDSPSPAGTYYYGIHVLDNKDNLTYDDGAKQVKVISNSISSGNQTNVNKRIVEVAKGYCKQPSGPSQIGFPWQTDIDGGDGQRIREAFTEYANTKNTDKMKQKLIQTYKGNDLNILVAKIKSSFDSNHKIPRTDQEVLDLLGIQRQCFEWANAVALESGGHTVSYDGSCNNKSCKIKIRDIVPGTGLYKYSSKIHSMVVIKAIHSNNTVTIEVAESNNATKWSNPAGDIPWERTVACGSRTFKIMYGKDEYVGIDEKGTKYIAVDYYK